MSEGVRPAAVAGSFYPLRPDRLEAVEGLGVGHEDLAAECFVRSPASQLVEEGAVDEAQIDVAVANILRIKFALGLFDQPYTDADEEATTFFAPVRWAASTTLNWMW